MSQPYVRIAGWGKYLPERIMPNAEPTVDLFWSKPLPSTFATIKCCAKLKRSGGGATAGIEDIVGSVARVEQNGRTRQPAPWR